MPSPTQTRALRIQHLATVATAFLKDGVASHLLFGKLKWATFRLWPWLREETRISYVTAALRAVLSRPHTEAVLPEAVGEIPLGGTN